MDRELATARMQVRIAYHLMQARLTRIDAERPRLSRHYATVRHTKQAVDLLEEIVAHLESDPDLWEHTEDAIPF